MIDWVPIRRGDSLIIRQITLELEKLLQLSVLLVIVILVGLFHLSCSEVSKTNTLLLVIFNHVFLDFNLRVVAIQSILFVESVEVQNTIDKLQFFLQLGIIEQGNFFIRRTAL